MYPIKIAGMANYVPRRTVYNEEIERLGGLTISTIEKTRTGVKERRWADIDGGENMIQMGANAIRMACERANIAVSDLDLILCASGISHQTIPDDAALVQNELGLGESGIRAFSVHGTCLSFMVALDVAGGLMADGRYRNVAVFSSVVSHIGIDFRDTHTAGLFGDGAAAAILVPSGSGAAIHNTFTETYGVGHSLCQILGGGTSRPASHPKHTPETDLFNMNGEGTAKLVSQYLGAALHRNFPGLQYGLKDVEVVPGVGKKMDIDWIIPHQASALALDAMQMFGWPKEKILRTLHKYGNCVSASIPITLCEGIQSGQIKRGDKVLIIGTSAGVSFGAMVFTY